ncbi:MAG: DUF4390 domain-containing protein, partial [Desulfobulbaceae bacterium]|nr:DUF4390 domain-containing protein [Desulfobulbaceae bacterium]
MRVSVGRKTLNSLMLCWLMLITPVLVEAKEAMIKDIVVTNSSSELLLFLRVVDVFSPEIIEGISNGLVATFNFDIRLIMVRDGWPDKEIDRLQLVRTMRFDSLKKEYQLNLSQSSAQLTTGSLTKAEALMTELNGVKVVPLSILLPDRQYVVKVRATLVRKNLP